MDVVIVLEEDAPDRVVLRAVHGLLVQAHQDRQAVIRTLAGITDRLEQLMALVAVEQNDIDALTTELVAEEGVLAQAFAALNAKVGQTLQAGDLSQLKAAVDKVATLVPSTDGSTDVPATPVDAPVDTTPVDAPVDAPAPVDTPVDSAPVDAPAPVDPGYTPTSQQPDNAAS